MCVPHMCVYRFGEQSECTACACMCVCMCMFSSIVMCLYVQGVCVCVYVCAGLHGPSTAVHQGIKTTHSL